MSHFNNLRCESDSMEDNISHNYMSINEVDSIHQYSSIDDTVPKTVVEYDPDTCPRVPWTAGNDNSADKSDED